MILSTFSSTTTSSLQNMGEYLSQGKERSPVKAKMMEKKTRMARYSVNLVMIYGILICCALKVVLDPKTSQRIFELAKDQQDELEMPEDDEEEATEVSSFSRPRMPVLQGDDDDDDDELYGDDIQDAEEIFVGSHLDLLTRDLMKC